MKLIITVGLPGSGKSTYLARLGVNAVSSDEIRRLIADDPHDQTMNSRIFSVIRYLIRQRIRAGRPATYVDATHLTPWEREPYVKLAQRYGCTLEALFFDVPIEICMARNQARERFVPEEAIRKMAHQMIPPSRDEGFAEITRIT
ncbi:MAG: ATP-binding protein [Bryobacteraceae bacterium]